MCSQLPVFLIGICLYYITEQTKDYQAATRFYATYVFLAGLIILHLLGGNIFKLHYLFALAFAFLSFGLAHYPAAILVNNFTAFIGKLSYSIYLVHLIVLNILFKYNFMHYNINASAGVFIRFVSVFCISTCISILTYNFVEIPFQRLGKRIINKTELKSRKIAEPILAA
ncbi:acyltransferase family protein [Mucilaginibacter sp.]